MTERPPSIQHDKSLPQVIGLRFDISGKDDIYYLIFYDIDKEVLMPDDLEEIDRLMRVYAISYLLYKSKHGFHVIGLSPLTHTEWASIFGALKYHFHSRYGGVVIRLSRKKDEKQELIRLEESYGEVIPNLFNLYAERFGLQKKYWIRKTSKYLLVFDHYRTVKE